MSTHCGLCHGQGHKEESCDQIFSTPIATMPPWLLSAVSESGDKYALRLMKKPSIREIEEMFRKHCPDEFTLENDGPGDFGSYLHIELIKDA